MNLFSNVFSTFNLVQARILDRDIEKFTEIDLSVYNPDLINMEITNWEECQKYIDSILDKNGSEVAYGGYLEERNLYTSTSHFNAPNEPGRNIHLGMDFWSKEGTKVIVPMDGTVHSFKNNEQRGDYGPTVILKHKLGHFTFYTLYGHLSFDSLKNLNEGREFKKGEAIGELGGPEENVGYAPHLHFQIILDLKDWKGDYPGVCAKRNLEYYRNNCPDPNLLLGL